MSLNSIKMKRNENAMDVCHMTSAHDRADTRIFYKLCRSLHLHGYNVALIVADGKPDADVYGVRVIGLGKYSSRILRMMVTPFRVFNRARQLKAKIYHFHDPELLLVGWMLRVFCAAQVVYDAHEDLPATVLAKTYIPKMLRVFIAGISNVFEKNMAAKMNAVVAATPYIQSKFERHNQRVVSICNYPLIEASTMPVCGPISQMKSVVYVGNLGVNRGVFEMIAALELCHNQIRFDVCGSFSEKDTEKSLKMQSGWKNVEFHGWVDAGTIRGILSRSNAGIVTLKPTPNYLHSLPVKMFEYMRAGLPVIASDFPEWRRIIQKYECGILVDPENPRAIAKAIDFIIDNPNLAQQMGKNGMTAVLRKFNWSSEEQKLFSLYNSLVKDLAFSS